MQYRRHSQRCQVHTQDFRLRCVLHDLANHDNLAAISGDAQAQVHLGWRCKVAGPHCVLDFLDNTHDSGHACGSTCHVDWMLENTSRLPAFVPAPCSYPPFISRHRPAPVSVIILRPRGGQPLEGGKGCHPPGIVRAQHEPAKPSAAHLFLPLAPRALG